MDVLLILVELDVPGYVLWVLAKMAAVGDVKLLPLPQPHSRTRTDISKHTESHSPQERTGACVLCLNTEPK
jgi:hypothetical protein